MSIRLPTLSWSEFDAKLHQQVEIQGKEEDFYEALTRSYNRLIGIQAKPLQNEAGYDEILALYETAIEVNGWMLENFERYNPKQDPKEPDANGITKNREYFVAKQKDLEKIIGFISKKITQAQKQLEAQQKKQPEHGFQML